jgi:hypothetical protein
MARSWRNANHFVWLKPRVGAIPRNIRPTTAHECAPHTKDYTGATYTPSRPHVVVDRVLLVTAGERFHVPVRALPLALRPKGRGGHGPKAYAGTAQRECPQSSPGWVGQAQRLSSALWLPNTSP